MVLVNDTDQELYIKLPRENFRLLNENERVTLTTKTVAVAKKDNNRYAMIYSILFSFILVTPEMGVEHRCQNLDWDQTEYSSLEEMEDIINKWDSSIYKHNGVESQDLDCDPTEYRPLEMEDIINKWDSSICTTAHNLLEGIKTQFPSTITLQLIAQEYIDFKRVYVYPKPSHPIKYGCVSKSYLKQLTDIYNYLSTKNTEYVADVHPDESGDVFIDSIREVRKNYNQITEFAFNLLNCIYFSVSIECAPLEDPKIMLSIVPDIENESFVNFIKDCIVQSESITFDNIAKMQNQMNLDKPITFKKDSMVGIINRCYGCVRVIARLPWKLDTYITRSMYIDDKDRNSIYYFPLPVGFSEDVKIVTTIDDYSDPDAPYQYNKTYTIKSGEVLVIENDDKQDYYQPKYICKKSLKYPKLIPPDFMINAKNIGLFRDVKKESDIQEDPTPKKEVLVINNLSLQIKVFFKSKDHTILSGSQIAITPSPEDYDEEGNVNVVIMILDNYKFICRYKDTIPMTILVDESFVMTGPFLIIPEILSHVDFVNTFLLEKDLVDIRLVGFRGRYRYVMVENKWVQFHDGETRKTLLQLCHRNVARVYDIKPLNGKSSITIKYGRQGKMLDYIKNIKLSRNKILELVIGICKGIKYLHKQDIIHGDINANNISIDGNIIGKADIPKISISSYTRLSKSIERKRKEITKLIELILSLINTEEYKCQLFFQCKSKDSITIKEIIDSIKSLIKHPSEPLINTTEISDDQWIIPRMDRMGQCLEVEDVDISNIDNLINVIKVFKDIYNLKDMIILYPFKRDRVTKKLVIVNVKEFADSDNISLYLSNILLKAVNPYSSVFSGEVIPDSLVNSAFKDLIISTKNNPSIDTNSIFNSLNSIKKNNHSLIKIPQPFDGDNIGVINSSGMNVTVLISVPWRETRILKSFEIDKDTLDLQTIPFLGHNTIKIMIITDQGHYCTSNPIIIEPHGIFIIDSNVKFTQLNQSRSDLLNLCLEHLQENNIVEIEYNIYPCWENLLDPKIIIVPSKIKQKIQIENHISVKIELYYIHKLPFTCSLEPKNGIETQIINSLVILINNPTHNHNHIYSYKINSTDNNNRVIINQSFLDDCQQFPTVPTRFECKNIINSILNETVYQQKYTDIGKIGSGSYGIVKLAFQLKESNIFKIVAIKYLHSDELLNQETIMRQSFHKNIVNTYKVFYTNDQLPAIVLEYCSNGGIGDYIKKTKPTFDRFLELMNGILDGIRYLHDQDIAHRDIKPENIVVDHHGVPKICDFGTSKVVLGTNGKTYVGTQGFNAPEVNISEENLGHEYDVKNADIYSYSVTVLSILLDYKPTNHKESHFRASKIRCQMLSCITDRTDMCRPCDDCQKIYNIISRSCRCVLKKEDCSLCIENNNTHNGNCFYKYTFTQCDPCKEYANCTKCSPQCEYCELIQTNIIKGISIEPKDR